MTALTVPARPPEDAGPRPVPWRRMAWVTWRQHRLALAGAAAFLGAWALYVGLTGLRLHHAYAAAAACHPAISLACAPLIGAFNNISSFLLNGLILQALPPLTGAFVGAPVLARELESGTFRYAWTQGIGRLRWAIAKLALLAAAVTAAGGACGLLFSWYFQPYFAPGNLAHGLTTASPFAPGLFGLRVVTFAAWTLAAFAIGTLAGMLIRRAVPAIAATLAVYTGLALVTSLHLREHYLAPLLTSNPNVPSSAWIISQQWYTSGHQPVSKTMFSQILSQAPRLISGKGGPPPPNSPLTPYLIKHGYTLVTSYQPSSRLWPFQWIEGGWLLALSVVLAGATLWLVGRRAT